MNVAKTNVHKILMRKQNQWENGTIDKRTFLVDSNLQLYNCAHLYLNVIYSINSTNIDSWY